MPVFEFKCRGCDARFEELVGSHVGTSAEDVRCPKCGSADLERLTTSSYAPVHRLMTAKQQRRLEDKRGTNRDGAKQRFKQQRAVERRNRPRGRGG